MEPKQSEADLHMMSGRREEKYSLPLSAPLCSRALAWPQLDLLIQVEIDHYVHLVCSKMPLCIKMQDQDINDSIVY